MNTAREPLFLRFVNKEVGVFDLLHSFSKSPDLLTQNAIQSALSSPPDLESFRTELTDAVRDIITTGIGDEFKAFVNNYMAESLEEDVQTADSKFGESISRSARVKDPSAPWIQGFLCYNLCLYVKAFGLEKLKSCKTCGKFFINQKKFEALFCSDSCKLKNKETKEPQKKRPAPLPGQRPAPLPGQILPGQKKDTLPPLIKYP